MPKEKQPKCINIWVGRNSRIFPKMKNRLSMVNKKTKEVKVEAISPNKINDWAIGLSSFSMISI